MKKYCWIIILISLNDQNTHIFENAIVTGVFAVVTVVYPQSSTFAGMDLAALLRLPLIVNMVRLLARGSDLGL